MPTVNGPLEDSSSGESPRRYRRAAALLLIGAVLGAATVAGASPVAERPPAAGPDGVTLIGSPMVHRFGGRVHESVQAVWEVRNTSAAAVEVDGVLRPDPSAGGRVSAAVDVFYGFHPLTGADAVEWVAAGTLAQPMSLQDACATAEHVVCGDPVPARGADQVLVKVMLERPELLTEDSSVDATFYLQYLPTQ